MLPEIKEKLKRVITVSAPPEPKKWSWKKTLWISAAVLGAGLFLIGGSYLYTWIYRDRVFPGVYAGPYHLGGLNYKEVKNLAENFNNRLAKEGLDLTAKLPDKEEKIKLQTMLSGDSAHELLKLDSDALAIAALSAGRSQNFWLGLLLPVKFRLLNNLHLNPAVVADETNLRDVAASALMPFSDEAHNAEVQVLNVSPLDYRVVPEKAGEVFNIDGLIYKIKNTLADFSFGPIVVVPDRFSPTIGAEDLKPALANLPAIFNYGNLEFNYVEPQTAVRRDWVVRPVLFARWLEARRGDDGHVFFGLKKDNVLTYLDELRPYVDQVPQDAKFTVLDGKVKEFQASQPGLSINAEKTYNDLDQAFRERNWQSAEPVKTVSLTVDSADPQVKMADANNLGIVDVIGTGYSTFHDSHTNRIKNIAHAVARLNGTLIAPGEEFSTVKSAGPFTAEIGYLPEEIIKGDKITKEIGGGMCQIGTTLFRMAMNSGMPITERRNHSLVVHYYSDPVNGNPGTDATVYEPILDFKFLNDTGKYLLLQTDINYVKQQLTFTLWGTPDGRKGWYSHPTVSRWIPAGDPVEIVSPDLKPGEKKCQNAFKGAVASFTYSRVTPAGEKIDRVFDSYYRPLPQICMVGPSSTPVCSGSACIVAPPPPVVSASGTEGILLNE